MKISKHKGNTSWAEGINYGTWDTNAFIMFRERYGHEINHMLNLTSDICLSIFSLEGVVKLWPCL